MKFFIIASLLFAAVLGQQCTGLCTNNNDNECTIPNTFCSGTTCTAVLANAAACTRDRQCASGACISGTCQQRRFPGCACTTDNQCTSLACVAGTCTGGSGRGGSACTNNTQCFSRSCVNGACTAYVGSQGSCIATACPAGQICAAGSCIILGAAGAACSAAAPCAAGLFCSDLVSGVCTTQIAAGQACNFSFGIQNCAGNNFCNASTGGTCVPQTAAGQNCSLVGFFIDPCVITTACTGGVCAPSNCTAGRGTCFNGGVCTLAGCFFEAFTRNAGQECAFDSDCIGNNVCVNKVCTVPLAVGATCNNTADACGSKQGSGCFCGSAGANVQTTCGPAACGAGLNDAFSRCVIRNQCGGDDFQCILAGCASEVQAVACCQCGSTTGNDALQLVPISGSCSAGFTFSQCCPGVNDAGCSSLTAACAPAPPSSAVTTVVSFVVLAVALVLALAF